MSIENAVTELGRDFRKRLEIAEAWSPKKRLSRSKRRNPSKKRKRRKRILVLKAIGESMGKAIWADLNRPSALSQLITRIPIEDNNESDQIHE
jgi:hypothetical protein